MKRTRKWMAVLLASTMMLATGMSAMAQVVPVVPESSTQQDGTAQITVANAAKGETYCIYKLFAATVTGEENGPIAYTGTVPDELGGFFEEDKARNVRATEAAFDNGEMSSGLKEALKAWVENAIPVATIESDGSMLHFNNLDYGYYIVTTTQGESAITVDSTNPTVTLYDKNSTGPSVPEDGKTVDDTTVHFGQELTYTIKFLTSNYDGAGTGAKQILSYTVTDPLPEFLSDVKLTSIMVDNDPTLDTDDQVQFTENEILGYEGIFKEKKTITIPWVEQNANPTSENDANGNYTSLYKNGAMVVITYTAKVTDTAEIDGEGNTNTFKLTWDVGDQEEHGGGNYTDSATVYTYAIALKKVDAKGNALADAKFQFPFYVQKEQKDGAYIYAGEEPGEGLTNEITTPADDGIIIVKGVDGDVRAENENDNGKYVIYEIEAPKGYNLLTEPVQIAPQMTKATNTTKTFYLDENGNVLDEATENTTSVTYENPNLSTGIALVVNHAGIELPSTGGIGTTIFAFAGLLLMAGAAGVMIIKKRG